MSKLLKRLSCTILLVSMLCASAACTQVQKPPEQETQSEANAQTTVPDTQEHTTEENTTKEDETDVKHAREIGERYFIYRIWNFTEQSQAQFEKTVDTAVADGFNAIKVHIPWSRVEADKAGEYDFSAFDPMIEYVVKTKGLKVAISLDLTRRADDRVIGLDQMQRDIQGNLCQGGSIDGMRTVISFCSESAVGAAVAFYADAVKRYDALYGEDVLFYLPAFTQYAESEYWPAGEYDYSDLAKNAFRAFLKQKYADIDALNAILETTYSDFSEIEPPSCSASDNLGVLWYQFRHQKLKGFIDALAAAQKAISPESKLALQFGSHFDAASVLRCTYAAGDLAENADVVWIDDGPLSDHEFSMDYADGMFPSHVQLAQEIDGPLQHGATPEKYLEQGNDCFTRGCTYVSIANWSLDQNYEMYKWVWKEISDTWLGENPPAVIDTTDTTRTMEIKLSQMLRKGNPGTFMAQYHALVPGEEYVYVKVVDDLSSTPVDKPQSIYTFPGAFSAEQGKGGWYYLCARPQRTKYVEMTFDRENNRWQGEAQFSLIMQGAVHPDAYDAVLAFKAPRDGEIRYSYSLSVNSENSDGIRYRVLLGDTVQTDGDKYGYVDLAYGEIGENTLVMQVHAGDMIYIAVNSGGNNSHDSTALSVEIEYAE